MEPHGGVDAFVEFMGKLHRPAGSVTLGSNVYEYHPRIASALNNLSEIIRKRRELYMSMCVEKHMGKYRSVLHRLYLFF